MAYELVDESDYAGLPVDPQAKWLALESICRRNLNKFVSDSNDAAFERNLRMQYMNIISAASEVLGIKGLEVSASSVANFESFLMSATRISTRLRLKSSSSVNVHSVALARPTKKKIEANIDRLRSLVRSADIDEHQKTKLLAKLDELSSIVRSPRTDFGSVMKVLAYVSTALFATTAFLADGPDAISTIAALIGEDKLAEEEELLLLEREKAPLQLPAPKGEGESDDDIPF